MPKQTDDSIMEDVQKVLDNDKKYGIPEPAKKPILELFRYAMLDAPIDAMVRDKWIELGRLDKGALLLGSTNLEGEIVIMGLEWTSALKIERIPVP